MPDATTRRRPPGRPPAAKGVRPARGPEVSTAPDPLGAMLRAGEAAADGAALREWFAALRRGGGET